MYRRANRPLFVCILCLVLALHAAVGCGGSGEKRLSRLVPALPRDVVHHVISSDDSTFLGFARESGNRLLRDAFREMHIALGAQFGPAFDERREYLKDPMYRIARVLDSEYGLRGQLVSCRALFDRPPEHAQARLQLEKEFSDIRSDRNLTAENRLEREREMLVEARGQEMPNLAVMVKSAISEIYLEIGQVDTARNYLFEALDESRALQMRVITCQLLGQLGGFYRNAGDIDSVRVCYEEALRLAKTHRLPEQAARIAMFYSSYYLREGRLSVAMAYYEDAFRYCREFKAGGHEIRVVLWAMEIQAQLGCWEAVEKLIQRARVLEKKFAGAGRSDPESGRGSRSIYDIAVDVFEARLLLARGDVDEAHTIFEQNHAYIKRYVQRGPYAGFLYFWADGLVSNGRYRQAVPVITEGRIFCRETHVDDWEVKFDQLSGRVALASNQAGAALDDVNRFADWYENSSDVRQNKFRIEHLENVVIRAKAQLLLGDTASAVTALETGLTELERSTAAMQGSVHGYLWLGRCTAIRDLLFDLTASDPLSGYGAVLYWQSLGHKLGSDARQSHDSRTASRTTLAAIKQIAATSVEAVGSRGATHVVYCTLGNEVWRWTVVGGNVDVDLLDCPRGDLEAAVQKILFSLSSDAVDPDAPATESLARSLRQLATDLLPASITGAAEHGLSGPVQVSAEGFLGKLPFGALNVGSDSEYVPLLELTDVVYVRHTGAGVQSEARREDAGIVFVVSRPSKFAASRFPLSGALPGAQKEGETVARVFKDSKYFFGATATRENLMANWEDASFLYFASHILRDPEIPYVNLIPMGPAAAGAGVESAFLDIADIRSADLGGCRVVVLSGCSSGAPSVMERNSVPALGDVFLDAGACAIVETFWDVRDRNDGSPMAGVIERWKQAGTGDAGVLCEQQRRFIHGPSGVRHPRNWATYFVKLGKF